MKLLLTLFAFCSIASMAQPNAEVAFTLKEKDLIPEGIAYDPVEKSFFVSSIRKMKIVKVSSRGTVSDFATSPRVDLHEVLGMKVDAANRKLWVCSNTPEHDTALFVSSIHVFDLKTGSLFRKYQVSGKKKHLFNDLVIASTGDVYVTDSDGGSVFVIRNNSESIEEFLKPKSIAYPNGIALTPDEKKLLVATGSGLGIVSIDLASKEIAPVRHPKYMLIGIDGLYQHGTGLIAVQNNTFPESVLRMTCNADFSAVEDIKFQAYNMPQIDLPTTGVIVDKYFYFIGNSQLLQVIGTKGALKDPSRLTEVYIMRSRIN